MSWIRKESYQLKTFVANRIATIQEMTSSEQWRYVANRGQSCRLRFQRNGFSKTENMFNILKDNWGRWKQHSRTLRGSFMARRKPRVLTLGQS
ncbi:hypothetical protein TNCV_1383521 [Trichonephila clavipes]|nr:hypothetical protein TNCV_1383521 [Trichonephila clavipes]